MHPHPPLHRVARSASLHQEVIAALEAEVSARERRLVRNQPVSPAQMTGLADCLSAFPCASGQYSRALNRLRNASAYYRAAEFGAARYELLTLVRELKPMLEAA